MGSFRGGTRARCLHLPGGGGQQHRLGQHPEHGEPVAFVCAELLRLSDQTGRADDRAKFIEDSGFHVVLSYQSNQRGCREQQPRCETKSQSFAVRSGLGIVCSFTVESNPFLLISSALRYAESTAFAYESGR